MRSATVAAMLEIGAYPTPVERLSSLSTEASSLWIKRDDLSNPMYGGNKVRKLAHLLDDAKNHGATRVVTVGGVGSHHVLATGIFGKRAGFRVDAALLSQPQSPHVLETIRATAAQGVGLFPVASYTEAKRLLESWVASGAYCIPAGGSNRLGTLGVMNAASELAAQVRAGDLPEPDLIVVPLGSGGTAAGLLAGLARAGLESRVLAVTVAGPPQLFARKTRALAKTLVEPLVWPRVEARLEIETSYLGDGYGHATDAGANATREAAKLGITLDDTYTAKAFAAALARVVLGRERTILYWQTLSSAPMAPLLLGAPREHELDAAVRRLAC
jgi:1-aminocyclopropane-1-carboxylate deaminase/D-cysteine desulfhydrase-like pyridoxal-dependent ACC family enzyme